MKNISNGMLSNFFENNDFTNLVLTDQINNSTINLDTKELSDLFDTNVRTIGSIRCITEIVPPNTGEYCFSLNHDNYIININNTAFNSNDIINNYTNLEANKSYLTFIEIQFSSPIKMNNLQNISIEWTYNKTKETIPTEYLYLPDLSDTKSYTIFPKYPLFKSNKSRGIVVNIDTDNDGIIDDWEINGYTIKNKKVVKWDESYAALGYKKFVSNPYNSHTANDPYTDFEKASRDFDQSILPEAQDPLVAAYPVINVAMERIIVSKDANWNEGSGTTTSKSTSTSVSLSMTEGISASVSVGLEGPSASVSAEFSTSQSTSNSVQDSNSDSFSKSLSINVGHAAYLSANVRYYNTGSAPMYNVKPTTSIIIKDSTIATILAQPNQVGNTLNPDSTYPSQNLYPIALNTFDQFSSHPIVLNYNQLEDVDNGSPVKLETTQAEGNFLTKNNSGESVTTGNNWNDYIGQIDSTSATLILEIDGKVFERRVVAKDFNNPEDRTPVLTLREALKKAFNLSEKSGKLYYNDKLLDEKSLLLIYDKNTESEINKQMNATNDKNIFNVNIARKMNILIKVPVDINMGVWTDTTQNGEEYCMDLNTTASSTLISSLKKYKKYLLTMDIKGDNNASTSIVVATKIFENINLTNEYSKVTIPFEIWNEDSFFITVDNNNYAGNIYFKNINIYESGDFSYNNQQIQQLYKSSYVLCEPENNSDYIDKISFNDVTDFGYHISEYGLICDGYDYGTKPSSIEGDHIIINPVDYGLKPYLVNGKVDFQVYILDLNDEKIVLLDGNNAQYLIRQ